MAAPALAAPQTGDVVVAQETDQDEPLTQDGNDDTGKYGLIGLTGLLGLFGYKKYKDHRAARPSTTGTTRGPVGDVDGDNSGSRKL
jgi:hypothetical protein